MATIEGIRIMNYRVLKDVTLGKLWRTSDDQPLTPITAVIGKNGVGKSSLFDAFGFLADCLKLGVEEACDGRGRGGFEQIRSQGSNDPIGFEVCYREEPQSHLVTYQLQIDKDDSDRPCVSGELLHQRDKVQENGLFLIVSEGEGFAWKGNTRGRKIDEDEPLPASCIKFRLIHAFTARNTGLSGRSSVWLMFTASEDRPHAVFLNLVQNHTESVVKRI